MFSYTDCLHSDDPTETFPRVRPPRRVWRRSEELGHSNRWERRARDATLTKKEKRQLTCPWVPLSIIRCVFCCSSAFFITRGRVHSWVEQSSHQGFLSKSPNLCSSQTGPSLCTVGTSSAFLQTADNICLLTCTVTRRTLLTPPYDPPVPRPRSSPQTPEHNSVPPPQAASSQCKLNLHFIYDAV